MGKEEREKERRGQKGEQKKETKRRGRSRVCTHAQLPQTHELADDVSPHLTLQSVQDRLHSSCPHLELNNAYVLSRTTAFMKPMTRLEIE
jgi:hypothetical protein